MAVYVGAQILENNFGPEALCVVNTPHILILC